MDGTNHKCKSHKRSRETNHSATTRTRVRGLSSVSGNSCSDKDLQLSKRQGPATLEGATNSRQWKYDVFVSFRGEDIRKTFMDHLFKDFSQKGIHAFRDDKELPRGEKVSQELYKAIEESRFLIVIFSKNYASSSWCLRELTKILECKQIGDQKHELRIIFYDVKPDVVRKQTGSYAKAFAKHVILNSTEVVEWKEALYEAANISGQDLQDTTNGYESKFIDKISRDILKKLCCYPLHVGDNLVGVDAYVNRMDLSRFIGLGRVHMIGICGISGIGKTTLARAIYNNMCTRFEDFWFCENVKGIAKQNGIVHVQMLLIENIMKTTVVKISDVGQGSAVIKRRMASKRILLVLDDVDDQEQLEALACSHNWFSPGSFIIFTSQDKQLLRSHKVDEIYDMKFLPRHEGLELFSLYAFGKKHPGKDFEELAYQVVDCLQGHPLALKVLGGCLYEKPINVWISELDRLKRYPHMKIQQKLRPSYDGLDFDQKRIFLDIACSLIGENKDFVASVLDSSDCFPDANIEVLLDKSLITISGNDASLQMHDLIQSMAKEIAREEAKKPGKRSRLWISSEICEVLSENKVTEAVEVLDLLLEESSQKAHIDVNALAQMKNLRILKICDQECGSFLPQLHVFELWNDCKVNYSGNLESLSNNLRLLYWHGCPLEFLPSDFYPENIVAIDLSYSRIKNLWTTPKCFRRLKVMKLKHCRNLTSIPDFTEIINLEELNLEGCVKLVTIHPSFGNLKRLVVLNMSNCKSFRSFLYEVETDSLEVMNLSGYSKLDKLPIFGGTIQSLKKLYVDGTALSIRKLLSFVFSRNNLQKLSIVQDERIRSRCWSSISQHSYSQSKKQSSQSLLMSSLAGLCLIQKLDFSDCNISELPDSIGGLSCLRDICLANNNFTSLPGCLSQLSRLTFLALHGCEKLEVLPELPPSIYYLGVTCCTSLEELQGLFKSDLERVYLDITGCRQLFMNMNIESQTSMSQTQPRTSYVFGSQTSSLFHHIMNISSTISQIFLAEDSSLWIDIVDIFFGGNRIPEWFTYQSMGNDVKIQLPPDWCYSKFRGYGIYVVFKLKPDDLIGTYPHFVVNNYDGAFLDNYDSRFPMWDMVKMDEDLIWFHFERVNLRWTEAKNFVTFYFGDVINGDIEVKECGVRLVCDGDMQEETCLCITQNLPTPAQGGAIINVGSVNNQQMAVYW